MERKNTLRVSVAAVWLALAISPMAARADAVTDQARGLIDQGKGAEAYRLLEPLEADRAGDTTYDLLLGIAALEAGQGTRGIFALERVLALEPNNVRARAEIARAYMVVGEADAAKAEFETAKKQGVPPEVASTIDKLIVAIDRMADASRTAIKGFVEASLGYDTNINAAPNRATVAIPGLGGLPFELSANSRNVKDGFGTVGAGVSVRHPLTKELALVGGLAGNQRWNSAHPRFDTGNVDAHAGLVLSLDRNVLSLTAQSSTLYLDADDYRQAAGLTALWQHNLDARNQLSAFFQYSDLQYTHQPIRDADRYVLGGAWAHAFRDGPITFLSAYGAQEKEQKANVPHLGHDAYGLRAGGQWAVDGKTTLFGSLTYEHRRYGGIDPAFLVRRIDNQYNVNVGATYALSKELSVTPQITYTDNQSNAGLNDYHREMFSVTIRREF